MSSSLISITDWIDRFGMELVDSEPSADEAPSGLRLVMSCFDDDDEVGRAAGGSHPGRAPNSAREDEAAASVRRSGRCRESGESSGNHAQRAPALLH